jgi:ATP-dependent Clp protease ATP-binding subunit ClpX
MIAYVDRFVRGQARAKQDIAVAVYNHYLSQAWRDRHGKDLGRYHILMIGPTGVGKTLLVKTLADFLDVPVGFTSAAGLVEAGYKGNSVETVVRGLLERAGGDPKKAEKGIIFIDEIDKIRRSDGAERDVSGEGVQNALLTMLDGRVSEGHEGQGHAAVDTGRILFVCTGAFVGLRDIVEARVGSAQHRFGFRPRAHEEIEQIPNNPIYEALCQAETRDLVAFGMIPEFIGRFATVAVLHELSRDDLRAIVSERTENSALERAAMLAKLHGIELVVTNEALDAIVDEAVALGTGARGLHRLIGRAVDPIDYRLPELAAEGVTSVVIDRECLTTTAEPKLVKGVLTSARRGFTRRGAVHLAAPATRRWARAGREEVGGSARGSVFRWGCP